VLAYPRNIEGTLTVLGDRGSARLGGRGLTQVERWEFAEYHDDDELMGEAAAGRVNLERPTHREIYAAAAATLADGAPNGIGGRDDRVTLELAVAIERAFGNGEDER
jgi:UDP-N-acetyl-2-amino-2-deoxyglucuronate dehydrogenase